MKNLLIAVLAIAASPLLFADSGGSYDYSQSKYPEITQLLNDGNDESCDSYVDVHQDNDGIISLGKDGNTEMLLVNYLTSCTHGSDSGSVLIQVENNIYSVADNNIPTPYAINHKGESYNLHYPETSFSNGSLVVSYGFACKEPASFVTVGDCSDQVVYEIYLTYTFEGSDFKLVATEIRK
jgi:hypothetical protein